MLESIILAFGLSMDAFAVSVGVGSKVKHWIKRASLAGLYFGVFQALMSAIGFFANESLYVWISRIDHWVAFVLLVFIGLKMIKEAFEAPSLTYETTISTTRWLFLAIATSIDALAAGFTLKLISNYPYMTIVLIGAISFLMSFLGVFVGAKGGGFLQKKADFIGGVILIAIGIKILLSHLYM